MQSRFGKILLCFGLALFSLLLLSCLVEGPAVFASAEALPPAPIENAAVWQFSRAPFDSAGYAPPPLPFLRGGVTLTQPDRHCAPSLPLCKDANGWVLQNARYLHNAYPLFHQELAAG